MRKVGATTSGSVIVEMTQVQFEALQQVVNPNSSKEETSAESAPPAGEVKTMAVKRKLDHVRTCILKLKPSTRDELIRSIKTVGPFTGGFADTEIDHLLRILAREEHFTISDNGTLVYRKEEPKGEKAIKPSDAAYAYIRADRSCREQSPLISG